VAYSGTDFHRADVAPSQAHSPPNVFIGGPVRNSPGFPPKAYGNDSGLEVTIRVLTRMLKKIGPRRKS
jgi:hypothetical protein